MIFRSTVLSSCWIGIALVSLALVGCGGPSGVDDTTGAVEQPVDASPTTDQETPPATSDETVADEDTAAQSQASVDEQVEDADEPGDGEMTEPVGEGVVEPIGGDAAESVQPAADGPGDGQEPGELFQGWPDPDCVLFITGRQHGYIEPCGCTGLTNQKGGLVRRYTCKQTLQDRGWSVVPLDVGNQVGRFGRQPEIKFQMTVEGLKQMDYKAIGFGPDDLRLSVGELVALTADEGDGASPFVCANTAVIDAALTPRYKVVEAGGKKIGITAVLSKQNQDKISSDEIVKSDPDKALQEVWTELQAKECDLYVLLAHASIEETTRLAQLVPHFDVVVTAGGAGEPTYRAESIAGTESIMVQVGTKGMYVGVVGLFDGEPCLRYERVPLDARFPDNAEMLQLLAAYQTQLKAAGLEGLGVKAIPHPTGRTYVGSDACEDCHDEEYKIWKHTPHAQALDVLIHPGERSEVPRHYDPECLSCHVVGWNPQQHFPYKSGYLGVEETPLMHNVGCENCHGPGSTHVDAEAGVLDDLTDELVKQYQIEMRLALDDAEKKCMDCHDMDNSPDFHVEGAFDEYWMQIEH